MITKLLRDSLPLVIDPQFAATVGLNEAIVIQQLHYWLKINSRDNRNNHGGYYWTYNSYADWQKQFPFWSEHTVRRIFQDLENKDYIICGNFNTLAIDRTKWYRLNYDKLDKVTIPDIEKPIDARLLISPFGNSASPYVQNGQMHESKLDRPLPENNVPETINILSKKEIDKEKTCFGKFNNVFLSEKEHQDLVTTFGTAKASELIENFSSSVASHGYEKKYKSHYATILLWEKRDQKKQEDHGVNGHNPRAIPKKYHKPDEVKGTQEAAQKLAEQLNMMEAVL